MENNESIENTESQETPEKVETEVNEVQPEGQEETSKEHTKNPRNSFSNRIRHKDKELHQLRRELEAEKAKNNAPARIEKPNEGDYNDPSLYESQKKKFDDQAREDLRKEAVEDYLVNQRYEDQQSTIRQNSENYIDGKDEAIETYKDYQASENFFIQNINQEVGNIVQDTENPYAIIDYFNKNKEELRKIANLSGLSAARKIGLIEAKLAKKPAKKERIPDPLPKAGTGAINPKVSLNESSQGDYNRRMNFPELYK